MKCYLVGGAVRDQLLGLTSYDRDWVVVGATEQAMLSAGYKKVGSQFPVFLHPLTKEEYALARTEKKTGAGYHGFDICASTNVTLEQDLSRRDLTINAMARSEDGTLVDPYGGYQDLRKGILRHISDAFSEDPVRILRVARFAARYSKAYVGKQFYIAEETMALMKFMVKNGESEYLTTERIWLELEKALHESAPENFFETLNTCDALTLVFNGDQQAYRQGLKALHWASAASKKATVRFSAFLSALTPKQILILCKQLRTPKTYCQLAHLTATHLESYKESVQLSPIQSLTLLKKVDAFRKPARFKDYLQASSAAIHAELKETDQAGDQQHKYLTAIYDATSKISSQDIHCQHLTGVALGREIDARRTEAISQLTQNFSSSGE